jgi:hypothetical protein
MKKEKCPTCGQEIISDTKNEIAKLAQLVHELIRPSRAKNGIPYVSPQAKTKIENRLAVWKFEELELAIKKFASNKWRMENNANKSLDWYFRTDAQIETFLQLESDLENSLTDEYKIGDKIYTSLEAVREAEKNGEIKWDEKMGAFSQAR